MRLRGALCSPAHFSGQIRHVGGAREPRGAVRARAAALARGRRAHGARAPPVRAHGLPGAVPGRRAPGHRAAHGHLHAAGLLRALRQAPPPAEAGAAGGAGQGLPEGAGAAGPHGHDGGGGARLAPAGADPHLDGRRLRHDALRPHERLPPGQVARHVPRGRRQRRRVHHGLQGRAPRAQQRRAHRLRGGLQVRGRGGAALPLHHERGVPAAHDQEAPHRLRRARRRPVHRGRQGRVRVRAEARQVPHHPAHRGRVHERHPRPHARDAQDPPHARPLRRQRPVVVADAARQGQGAPVQVPDHEPHAAPLLRGQPRAAQDRQGRRRERPPRTQLPDYEPPRARAQRAGLQVRGRRAHRRAVAGDARDDRVAQHFRCRARHAPRPAPPARVLARRALRARAQGGYLQADPEPQQAGRERHRGPHQRQSRALREEVREQDEVRGGVLRGPLRQEQEVRALVTFGPEPSRRDGQQDRWSLEVVHATT
ncbi:hypothetical protein ON010_g5364 [Phytophthora cinnamomi]|nr:hypothetical protein ON010_g5364 [Phytophthora cinnamomi]